MKVNQKSQTIIRRLATKWSDHFVRRILELPNGQDTPPPKVKGRIDKISLSPQVPLELELKSFISKCKNFGYSHQSRSLSEGHFSVIENEGKRIFCKIRISNDVTLISSLFMNPSDFCSFGELERMLCNVFGDQVLLWNIRRMDFACDIYQRYSLFAQGFSIKKKSKLEVYKDSTKVTGGYYGGRSDMFVVYCKTTEQLRRRNAKEGQGSEWVSRVERRLSGKKAPFRNLEDLRDNFHRIRALEIFDAIEIFYPVAKSGVRASLSACCRKLEIAVLIKYGGFQFAKKTLRQERTFERDFDRFYIKRPKAENFRSICIDEICDYFTAYPLPLYESVGKREPFSTLDSKKGKSNG